MTGGAGAHRIPGREAGRRPAAAGSRLAAMTALLRPGGAAVGWVGPARNAPGYPWEVPPPTACTNWFWQACLAAMVFAPLTHREYVTTCLPKAASPTSKKPLSSTPVPPITIAATDPLGDLVPPRRARSREVMANQTASAPASRVKATM